MPDGENIVSEWTRARQEWLAQVCRGSLHTARMYNAAMGHLGEFVNPMRIDQVGGNTVTRWANHMAHMGLSETTINARLAAVSSFFCFCQHWTDGQGRALATVNPVDAVKRYRVDPYGNSQPLSVEEVGAVLGAVDRTTAAGLRDYAVLMMALYTGRRSAELRGLRWGDIQHTADGRARYAWRGKGGKARWDDLPQPALIAIRLYLDAARRRPEPDEPVFVQHNGQADGKPLTSEWLNAMVQRYAAAAGIRRIHAHTLRHTAANLRARAGHSLESISMLLAHSSLRVTQIYLQRQAGFVDTGWQDVEQMLAGGQVDG